VWLPSSLWAWLLLLLLLLLLLYHPASCWHWLGL
jgi:hypothetical protein